MLTFGLRSLAFTNMEVEFKVLIWYLNIHPANNHNVQTCVFQDYKPVYFSPSLGTSLAEAELEYKPQHVSPSVFLALPVTSALPVTLVS